MSDSALGARTTIFRESGLIVVFIITLLYVGTVFLAPGSPVRAVLGFIELVFAPGYALGAILFVRKPLVPVPAEFSIAVGLSVVYNVLVGLVLALQGSGLVVSWLVIADTAAVSLGLVVKAVAGDSREARGVSAAVRRELRLPGVRQEYRTAAYALLVACLLAFAGVVYLGVTHPVPATPTSLAVYGPGGTSASLPVNLTVGNVAGVVLSIRDGYSAGAMALSVNAALVVPKVTTNPMSVVYDNGTKDLFVANSASNNVSVVSSATNAIVAKVAVGTSPTGEAYDSARGEVFVTDNGAQDVSVISDVNSSLVATIGVQADPAGAAYDNRTGEVFVTDYGSNDVSVISDTTDRVVATVPVGQSPTGVTYDSGKGEVFVANNALSDVSVISDLNNTIVATIPVGSNPVGIAYDGARGDVFVANNGSADVSVISDTSDTVVATIPVGEDPTGIAYASGAGELFVTDYGEDNVSVISDSTDTVVATIGVGPGPTGVAYDAANGEVLVRNNPAGSLSVIADSSNSVITTIALNAGLVPWSLPLSFGVGANSSFVLSLAYGDSTTLDVTFHFTVPGTYVLTFTLEAAGVPLLQGIAVPISVGV